MEQNPMDLPLTCGDVGLRTEVGKLSAWLLALGLIRGSARLELFAEGGVFGAGLFDGVGVALGLLVFCQGAVDAGEGGL